MSAISYYTLSTIFLCALVFSIRCACKRDWLSLFVHPYLIVCFFFAFTWHKRTIYPDMMTYVDILAAVSFVLVTLGFWGAYWLVPERFVNSRFLSFFQWSFTESRLADISTKTYMGLFVFVLAWGIGDLVVRFFIANDWNEWLFAYRKLIDKNVEISYGVRLLSRIVGYLKFFAISCLGLLCVIPFCKKTKLNSYVYISLSLLLYVFAVFILFGSGSRYSMFLLPFFLVMSFFTLRLCRYSTEGKMEMSVAVIPTGCLCILLSLVTIMLSGLTRTDGVDAIVKLFTTKQLNIMEEVTSKTLQTHTADDIAKMTRIFSDENDPWGVLGFTDDPKWSTPEQAEQKQAEQKQEIQQRKLQPLRMLKPICASDQLAKYVLFYGTHYKFYGLSNFPVRTAHQFIWQEFFPKEKRLHPYTSQFNKDLYGKAIWGIGHPAGLYAEGWFYYGYTGAVLFSILGGIVFGGIAKIINTLQNRRPMQVDIVLMTLNLYTIYVLVGFYPTNTILLKILFAVIALLFVSLFINTCNFFTKRFLLKQE